MARFSRSSDRSEKPSNSLPKLRNRPKGRRLGDGLSPRSLNLEPFEERLLFAIGPSLLAILPTDGSVLSPNAILTSAPTQFTLRFDSAIDPNSLIKNGVSSIQITRGGDHILGNGNDIAVAPSYLAIGDNSNEVIVRFSGATARPPVLAADGSRLADPAADPTTPDDVYQIKIVGSGANPLKGITGQVFNGGADYFQNYTLNLPPQVTGVVPQPVTRLPNGTLQQNKNEIDVYFNVNDPLNVASAQTNTFYQLIRTQTTADSTDDVLFTPTSVTYSQATGKAVLTFNAAAFNTPGVYRLRVGNADPLAVAPQTPAGSGLPGSSFASADNLGSLFPNSQGNQSINTLGLIGGSPVNVVYPGGNNEPGTRNIDVQNHFSGFIGQNLTGTIPVVGYNFQNFIGTVSGVPVNNVITDAQKARVREVLAYYSSIMGVEFVEVANSSITQVGQFPQPITLSANFTVATGDVRVVGSTSGVIGTAGVTDDGTFEAVVNSNIDWGSSESGGAYFLAAMESIGFLLGLGKTNELPSIATQGDEVVVDPVTNVASVNPNAEVVTPGDAEKLLGQYLLPPTGNDISMYKFTLPRDGTLNLETFAERLTTLIPAFDPSLLDTVITLYDVKGNVIGSNDNYFGKDSFLRVALSAGTYYVGVTSSGNSSFDPTVANSGFGGLTEGEFGMRLTFSPNVTNAIKDSSGQALQLDGDSDGVAGGAYNFWFRVADDAHTVFVDKAATNGSGTPGSITNPFTTISDAMNVVPLDGVVRIVANGGADNNLATVGDNLSYNIGFDALNRPLSDGSRLEIPRRVTVMVDAGAIIKLRQANIDAGTSVQGLNRDDGVLQVLGYSTNQKNDRGEDTGTVYFTSYNNTKIGKDNGTARSALTPGDWGGLVFRNDPSLRFAGDQDLEVAGVFMNYVNYANITYGGGTVVVNSIPQVYDPIHLVFARPTISYNTIAYSADAAISADPNSFQESEFRQITYDNDYVRSGPNVHNNTLSKNSINGLFVRIRTDNGSVLDPLTVSARFSSTDIVYVLSENMEIEGTAGGLFVDPATGRLISRPTARLLVDPGVIVKLGGSRIETNVGAQFIAEGTTAKPIIFTSVFDDRYGAGGVFDTTNDGGTHAANEGDWGGLYFGGISKGSIDHALITYGGGSTTIEGGFAKFNAVEIHQADVRLTNSILEHNAAGGDGDRNGRGPTTPAVIFVRGAQPVIVNNIIQNNDTAGTSTNTAAISINVNSLNSDLINDWGRSTGLADFQVNMPTNTGPLIRGNKIGNTPINGMMVRGGTMTTEGIWDDTDIVHVVEDEIIVPNRFSLTGSLRLQSNASESLVVKLFGANAGFTATGTPLDIDDRIGGTLQIVGVANHPVILTSLYDTTAGAGFMPGGAAQVDTANQKGALHAVTPGDWRSVKIDTYSNDTNMDVMNELEQKFAPTGDTNSLPTTAQFLGQLAKDSKSGDDNSRLGFEIHGSISQAASSPGGGDVDVYSFQATAGSTVWFDIDRTASSLDSVVELVDANGAVQARSDNSIDEQANPALLVGSPTNVKPMQIGFNGTVSPYTSPDFYSTNPKDAGMRVDLPGTAGTVNTYFVRVRSSSGNLSTLNGGLTKGSYDLQIRLQNEDQFPGSVVRNADIRFATTGVEIYGKPDHSPLLGDTAESALNDNTFANAQLLGNLLASSQNEVSVAGNLPTPNSVAWFKFALNYTDVTPNLPLRSDGTLAPFALDFSVNFADGLSRPDTMISVFDPLGNLIGIARDSNNADSQPTPTLGADTTNLAHGNYGVFDPSAGPITLPAGGMLSEGDPPIVYYVAVSSFANQPAVLDATINPNSTNSLVRLSPIPTVAPIYSDSVANATDVNLKPTPLTMGDLVLYASTANNLYTIDPLTGQVLTRITSLVNQKDDGSGVQTNLPNSGSDGSGDRAYYDITMRSDGRLMTYPQGTTGTTNNSATNGNLLQISAADGSLVSAANTLTGGIGGANPIATNGVDPNNPIDPQTGQFAFVGTTSDRGVAMNGMTYAGNQAILYAIGNRNSGFGIQDTQNLLYRFDGTSGAEFPNDTESTQTLNTSTVWVPGIGQVDANGDPIFTGSGTNLIPRGTLTTGNYLIGAPVTGANSAQDIRDGLKFSLGGNGTTIDPKIFEFDTGPVLTLTPGGIANLRDGDTFKINGVVFELNGGPVISANSSGAGMLGQTFQIQDTNGQFVTFEFGTAAQVAPGNVPVAIGGTPAQVAANIVTAINFTAKTQFPTFAVTASVPSATSTRVSLVNDNGITLNAAGLSTSGDYTTAQNANNPTGFNLSVNFEETYSVAQLGNALTTAVNTATSNGIFVVPVTASFQRDRVGFLGAAGTPTPDDFSKFTAAPVSFNLNGNTGVTAGAIAIPVLMTDDATTVAGAITTAINSANLPFSTTQFYSFLTGGVVHADQEGANVKITGLNGRTNSDQRLFVNVGGTNGPIITDTGNSFSSGGSINEVGRGDITGIADLPSPTVPVTGQFLPDRMFAVSDSGGVYQIVDDFNSATFLNNNEFPDFNDTSLSGSIDTNNSMTTKLLGVVFDENGNRVHFTSVTAGPPNVENGRYQYTLFATDNQNRIWAFDVPFVFGATVGTSHTQFSQANIFVNGANHVQSIGIGTGVNASPDRGIFTGLTFSTLDYNLWHVTGATGTDNTNGLHQNDQGDPGHSGVSYYFGLSDPGFETADGVIQPQGGDYSLASNGAFQSGNANLFNTYNLPGGAMGSLTSTNIDLSKYSAFDKPTLYFNYYLDTQLDQGAAMSDSFRVFASSDGANWTPLVTNNTYFNTPTVLHELPATPSVSGGQYQGDKSNQRVQEAFDKPAASDPNSANYTWRQARVDLGDFVGKSNVQLRFDFSTAGGMGTGLQKTTTNFQNMGPGGVMLAGVDASQLANGNQFVLNHTLLTSSNPDGSPNYTSFNDTFTFRSGLILTAPVGGAPMIQNGETFTIAGKTYQFTRTGTVVGSNVAVSINDGMAPEDVARAIFNAMTNSAAAGVTPRISGASVQMVGATSITQSPNARMILQGTPLPATLANSDVTYTIDMTAEQVAQQVTAAINKYYAALNGNTNDLTVNNTAKVNGRSIRLFDHNIVNAGPLPSSNQLPGDNNSVFFSPLQDNTHIGLTSLADASARAKNNGHQGVYIDDVMIGLAGRGEVVQGANAQAPAGTAPNTAFQVLPFDTNGGNDPKITTGNFQLNIRRATQLSTSDPTIGLTTDPVSLAPAPFFQRPATIDVNDRMAQGISLFVPAAAQLVDGQTFSIAVENGIYTFEFDTNNSVAAGNFAVPIANGDDATAVAAKIVTAVNNVPATRNFLVKSSLPGGTGTAGIVRSITGTAQDFIGTPDETQSEINNEDVLIRLAANETTTNNSYVRWQIAIVGGTGAGQTRLITAYNGKNKDATVNLPWDVLPDSTSVYSIRYVVQLDLFNAENVNPGPLGMIIYNGMGDETPVRPQGMTIVQSTRISDSARAGVTVLPELGPPNPLIDPNGNPIPGGIPGHTGSTANLPTLNTQKLVPGTAIKDNLIVASGQAGIAFWGAPTTDISHAVPFGRIVNNTIVQSPVGIDVEFNASPTILNNIIAQNLVGIKVDATSTTTVVGASVYQGNGTNLQGVGETNAIVLQPTDPLFVDTTKRNFYLKALSPAIDSSVNTLQERAALSAVTAPLGIPPSPIQAPNTDLLGQLRVDDPSVQSPPGLGSNVFKDRGALERADFSGPTTLLVSPADNDAAGVDRNPAPNRALIVGQKLKEFTIQFTDLGIGVDDSTVTPTRFTVQRTVNNVTTTLALTTDYFFAYDATNKIVRITPAQGSWSNATYTITVNNSANPVKDLAGNLVQANDPTGVTQFIIQQTDTGSALWQNPVNKFDVNNNGTVTNVDLIVVINALLVNHVLTDSPPPPYYDVSGDNLLSPLDALQLINFLSVNGSGSSAVNAAPAALPAATAAAALPTSTDSSSDEEASAAPASLAASSDDLSPIAFSLGVSQAPADDLTTLATAITTSVVAPSWSSAAASSAAIGTMMSSKQALESTFAGDTWNESSNDLDSILSDLVAEPKKRDLLRV